MRTERREFAAPQCLMEAMHLTDICCNFTHSSFDKDREEVLDRAKQAGIGKMIVTGSSVDDSHAAIVLVNRYPDTLYASVGVHPHHASDWDDDVYQTLKNCAAHEKVVAIGETGLDYNRNFSPQENQRDAFERQIQLAIELGKPLFMHQRDAHDDFIALLRPHRDKITNGVVHCFTGDAQQLADYIDLDLYIGITGWICDERRGRHLHELITEIPPEKLLLETDAPYLLPRDMTPPPKDRRNEPAFLAHVASRVAAHAGVEVATLSAMTSDNAKRLFGFDT